MSRRVMSTFVGVAATICIVLVLHQHEGSATFAEEVTKESQTPSAQTEQALLQAVVPEGARAELVELESSRAPVVGMPPVPLSMPPLAKATITSDDTVPEGMPSPIASSKLKPGIVESTHVVEIKTPALKSQSIRKMVLPNGMKVMITSDPELPMSATGIANADGSWQDPNDALGLAHFNEHMEFMGTVRHPKPASFDEFLTAAGAQQSNAQTGAQTTQYAFNVGHEFFPEALERFADLFTQPLFDDAGLHKEIHAVNQEYEMHKDDDGWRQLFVQKKTANPEHPNARFSIGTLHSLGKVDHAKIKQFYETHYSANLMAAAVFTKLPLDEAEKLVREKLSVIPNRHLKKKTFTMPLLDPARKATAIWQLSIKNTHSLTLQWELPTHLSQAVFRNAKVQPATLVGYILNYQGENTLFQHLRKANLAHSVSLAQSDSGYTGSILEIDVDLTPAGFKQWKHVVNTVFEALAAVRKSGVPKHVFNTLRTTNLQSVQWQWRTADVFDKAMDQCGDLLATPDEGFASYPYLDDVIQEFDPKEAMDLLAVLQPADVHIYGLAPEYPAGMEQLSEDSEHHYHTKWKQMPLEQQELEQWTAAAPATFVQVPAANPLLPKKLAVTRDLDAHPPVYPNIPTPTKLIHTDKSKVYIWEDKMFGDPYVTGHVTMKTDKAVLSDLGVDALIALGMLTTCVNHGILPAMVPYNEASLSWGLGSGTGTNLELSFKGTNTEPEHYRSLLTKLAGYMADMGEGKLSQFVDAETFEMLKTSTVHSLENAKKSSPMDMALQKVHHTMLNMRYPIDEQIAAAKRATFASVSQIGPAIFKRTFFEGFFSGQLHPHDVEQAWTEMMQVMGQDSTPVLPKKAFLHDVMTVLPEKPTFMHTQGSTTGNAAVLVVDAGGLDCREREALSMLMEAVPMEFYNDLRSKQQVGYLVQSSPTVYVAHHDMLLFLVQSSQYDPGNLVHRFNKFIADTVDGMQKGNSKTLPEKKFDMIKKTKLATYDTPNQNIAGVTSLMQTLMSNYDEDWQTMAKKKQITQDLQHADVLAIGRKVLGASNKRKLFVGYTPDTTKMGKMPEEFVEFESSMTTHVGKAPFQCPVTIAVPTTPRLTQFLKVTEKALTGVSDSITGFFVNHT